MLVSILLLISILLEQYWIARFFPWIGGLGGFRPMIVFLDIPLALPNIDWIPVSILFAIFYSIVISPELSRSAASATSYAQRSGGRSRDGGSCSSVSWPAVECIILYRIIFPNRYKMASTHSASAPISPCPGLPVTLSTCMEACCS